MLHEPELGSHEHVLSAWHLFSVDAVVQRMVHNVPTASHHAIVLHDARSVRLHFLPHAFVGALSMYWQRASRLQSATFPRNEHFFLQVLDEVLDASHSQSASTVQSWDVVATHFLGPQNPVPAFHSHPGTKAQL